MMFQVGDDGVVSSVNEEDLIYVDKNELEQFVESYHQLEKEMQRLYNYLKKEHNMNTEDIKKIMNDNKYLGDDEVCD